MDENINKIKGYDDVKINKIYGLLLTAAVSLGCGFVVSQPVAASDGICSSPVFMRSNTETSLDIRSYVSGTPTGSYVVVEYESDEGERIKTTLSNPAQLYRFEIAKKTRFQFQLLSNDKQVLKEWAQEVSPIVTEIKAMKNGDTTISVNTEPDADVEYSYQGEVGTSRRSLTTDETGAFRGEFSRKGDGYISIDKEEGEWRKHQSVSVRHDDIDASPPVIVQTRYQNDDESRDIQVDIDDSIRMIQAEYLDKDKRVIKNSTIGYSSDEGTRKGPYYINNTGEHTFKEDGIRYVRLKGVNRNGCESDWKVFGLNYVTGPFVKMDPSLKGDMYVSGSSEPGSRIVWSQDQSIGTSEVGADGRFKINLPKEITRNLPKLKFYDDSKKESKVSISVLDRIDRFMATKSRNSIYVLAAPLQPNFGRHVIELNGKKTSLVISGKRIHFYDGNEWTDFPKLPFTIKFSALNLDGTTKYSFEQVVNEEKAAKGINNIRYDLNKQILYGESNLFYHSSLWNEKTRWSASTYAYEKQVSLPLSDKKELVKVGDTISLYSQAGGDGSFYAQSIVIKQTKKLQAPIVKEVTDFSNYVEGSTLPNMTVQMQMDGKKYSGMSSSTGKFRFKVAFPSAGKMIQVFATDHLNQKTPVITSKVLRVFPYFSVSDVTTRSTEMKGRGSVGAEVNIFVGKKLIGKTTIDKKEVFSIRLPKLKKGTTLKIDVSKKDYQTRSMSMKVN